MKTINIILLIFQKFGRFLLQFTTGELWTWIRAKTTDIKCFKVQPPHISRHQQIKTAQYSTYIWLIKLSTNLCEVLQCPENAQTTASSSLKVPTWHDHWAVWLAKILKAVIYYLFRQTTQFYSLIKACLA